MQHGSRSKIRQEYVESMIKTCFVNRDKAALSEILSYLINRYKNDINLLKSVYELCLDSDYIKHFNAEHWEFLVKIQKIFDITNKDSWRSYTFYQSYLTYLFDNDKSVDEIIKSIIQKNADKKMHGFDFIHTEKYQKMYCDKIASCIDAYEKHEVYKDLIVQFLSFASRVLKLEELLEYKRFFNQLVANDWQCRHILHKAIKVNDDQLHDLFWQIGDIKGNEILMWYARNRPDRLKENAPKICDLIDEYRPAKFLQTLKPFIDEDLKETLKMYALDVIDREDLNKIKVPILLLAVFSPVEFFELISNAIPPLDGKVDLEVDTDKINMQRAFIDGLRYTQDPAMAFPWLLKFCVGDYLKFALSSLYGLAYNTAEVSVKQYVEELSNTALSVKKHHLLLGRHLFLYDDFYNLLKSWSDTEKNLSMRNILLTKAFEYLSENQSENLWILAKQNLKSFNPADRGIYDFLLKFNNIPFDHMPEYIEAVFKAIVANSDSKINQRKFELIEAIPLGLINKLNLKFLKLLIRETVCSKTETNFFWKCVFHVDETKRSELFEANFAQLKEFAEENTFDINQPAHVRAKISNFVLCFVKSAIQSKKNGNLVEEFMTRWRSLFSPENYNKDFLLIEFTNLLFESEFSPYEAGVKINALLYEYIKNYNSSVIDFFCRQLLHFLSLASINTKDNDLFKFVDGFFYEKKDENIYVAVIYFLPKALPTTENRYTKYLPIFETVQNSKYPVVRYHFNLYLCNL